MILHDALERYDISLLVLYINIRKIKNKVHIPTQVCYHIY